MASSLVPRSRRAVLAGSAAVLLALPATGYAAPKAPYPPPNHPTPAAQAASAGHARTPSDRDPALAGAIAQERYYGSYGTAEPAAAPVPAVPADEASSTDGGVATTAFALAVAAALVLGIGLGRLLEPGLARLHAAGSRHGAAR